MSKKLYISIVALAVLAILLCVFFMVKPFFEDFQKEEDFFDTTVFVEEEKEENTVEGSVTIIEVPIDFQKLWGEHNAPCS